MASQALDPRLTIYCLNELLIRRNILTANVKRCSELLDEPLAIFVSIAVDDRRAFWYRLCRGAVIEPPRSALPSLIDGFAIDKTARMPELPADIWRMLIQQHLNAVDRFALSQVNRALRHMLNEPLTWSNNATETTRVVQIQFSMLPVYWRLRIPRLVMSLVVRVGCYTQCTWRHPDAIEEALPVVACKKCVAASSQLRLVPAPTAYLHRNLPEYLCMVPGRRRRDQETHELMAGPSVRLYLDAEIRATAPPEHRFVTAADKRKRIK